MTLLDGSYRWEFIPVEGETATDTGEAPCVEPSPIQVIETQISSPADDAEERSSGSVLIGSSDLELTFDAGSDQVVGLRFDGVSVPSGATITDAWVQFTTDETGNEPTSLSIRGAATDALSPYSGARFDISSRETTVGRVAWSPAPWLIPGESSSSQRTPDLSSIVQEITDRSGWQTGAAMGFVITGTGERVAESFEGSSAGAPILHIEYLPPADTPPTLDIVQPAPDTTVIAGTALSFEAVAVDAEDGPLTGSVVWTSDLDGVIGTGSPVVETLSIGTHRVVASVSDSAAQTTTAELTVEVTEANPPSVIELVLASGSDDAEERSSGTVYVGSSDLELTFDFGASQTVGLRYDSVPVPDGATITAAWIQFTVDEVSTDPTNLVIRAEAADAALGYTDLPFSISARPTTTSAAPWTPAPWLVTGLAGPEQRSSDVSAVLQEVIDRAGWVEGSAVNFIITGTGERVAESFEGGASKAPVLHIEYTP